MTDTTRVSDGSSAAESRTHSDNFDRTELFNSFGKTTSEKISTDTTRSNSDSSINPESQFKKSDATDSNPLPFNQNDRQNGEHANDSNRRSDAKFNGDSLEVSNVFEELGLTRGLSSRGNSDQPAEGKANRSPLKGSEQQLPQISFFDSASASSSSRVEVLPAKNKSRDQQPTNRGDKPGVRQGDRLENSQMLEGAKPQSGMLVENLGASKEFSNKVQKQIDSLTPETRAALESSGVEIITTDKLTSVRPDLKGKEPYNQSGSTYENLDAFYLPNSKSIVIAESRENRAGKTVPNDRVEGVVKHEVGHALDESLGNFSQSPAFVEAHKKDTENLKTSDKSLFSYLVGSKDGDGKKEAFADVWGALNGASSNPQESKRILEKFPNVANLIKEQLPQYIRNKSR